MIQIIYIQRNRLSIWKLYHRKKIVVMKPVLLQIVFQFKCIYIYIQSDYYAIESTKHLVLSSFLSLDPPFRLFPPLRLYYFSNHPLNPMSPPSSKPHIPSSKGQKPNSTNGLVQLRESYHIYIYIYIYIYIQQSLYTFKSTSPTIFVNFLS